MKENLEAKREGGGTSLMGKVYQEKGPKDRHYSFGACLFLFGKEKHGWTLHSTFGRVGRFGSISLVGLFGVTR